MKEPYESIRKKQTGQGLEEVEAIRDVPHVALRLIKQIFKKRIEYTVKACAEVKDGN